MSISHGLAVGQHQGVYSRGLLNNGDPDRLNTGHRLDPAASGHPHVPARPHARSQWSGVGGGQTGRRGGGGDVIHRRGRRKPESCAGSTPGMRSPSTWVAGHSATVPGEHRVGHVENRRCAIRRQRYRRDRGGKPYVRHIPRHGCSPGQRGVFTAKSTLVVAQRDACGSSGRRRGSGSACFSCGGSGPRQPALGRHPHPFGSGAGADNEAARFRHIIAKDPRRLKSSVWSGYVSRETW